MENWKNELDRWGWWHVEKFHGDASSKEAVLQAASSGYLEILITTYTTYKNHKGRLNLIEWDAVVADECHQIKVIRLGKQWRRPLTPFRNDLHKPLRP